jgi:hypothetical protein
MVSEKNEPINLTENKAMVKKRKITRSKAAVEKVKTEKVPKKSKLAVRIIARDLKIKDETEAVPATEERISVEQVSMRGKKTKLKPEENAFFDRVSCRIGEVNEESIEIAEKKADEDMEQSHPVGLYRKISLFFVILTLALLAAAFYFFFMTLTVEVTPNTERVTDKIDLKVNSLATGQPAAQSVGNQQIVGSVEQIPVKEDKTYPATGEDILGQEITGKVEIVNNYTQDKTLVATTRLLSSDGKLFRIKDRVMIPAGGSTSVEIYADEPSQDMAIGPTEFIIPGLWAGLQDKIFAKSSEAFVYKKQIRKFIQASDIEKANEDLKESLTKKIADQFNANYKGFDKVIAELDNNSLLASTSARTGAKAEEFTISLKGMADVIAFKSADAKKLAEDKLISVLPADEKLVDLEKIDYHLLDTDFGAGSADLEISFVGSAVLSDLDNVVDRERLVGLKADQITKYLEGLNKFSSIKLHFTPPFIGRAPNLVDRIKILIK